MLLTVEQTAERLAVSAETVRDYARRGLIPAAKLGKSWRIPADQLDAHIREQATATATATASATATATATAAASAAAQYPSDRDGKD